MAQGWLQLAVFVAIVVALTRPLGAFMARVYRNERVVLTPVFGGGRAAKDGASSVD
jgi:K+-transporting ATPase ATPase A chain